MIIRSLTRVRSGDRIPKWAIFLLLLLLVPAGVWAKPTTPGQAQLVVTNWLRLDWKPLGCPLGQEIKEVQTFRDAAGSPLYHVVYLTPAGLVLVAGDDLVEPIVGFLAQGRYDPSPANCLGYLVSRDLPGRVDTVRKLEAQARAQGLKFTTQGIFKTALDKWEMLAGAALGAHLDRVSDERVPPLTQSKWGQRNAGNNTCYNMFTPNNYVCGCAATALAQLMRYHKYPTTGIGVNTFPIFVDGVMQNGFTRGGDGQGGPYNWNDMVLAPDGATPFSQRRAIGFLCSDAGVVVNMHYSKGSSAFLDAHYQRLVNIFKYSNIKFGTASPQSIPSATLNAMINPNLDAGLPVILGGGGPVGGHFWLADGYGYHVTTLYRHLNLGWDGAWNLWYNLPNIDSNPALNVVDECWYNIYKSGTGEVISGRVLTPEGYPVTAVTVKAVGGGKTFQTVSNGRGIYAFAALPVNTTFTIQTWGLGTTKSISTTTGKSQNGTLTTGNKWGQNLVLQPVATRTNACWAHGVKILPEAPWLLAKTSRCGWGSYFWGKENTANWFHIPLATPVIKEGRRTVLTNVYVYFATLGNAKITNIAVWDGQRQIRAFDGLNLSGSHLVWDRWNKFSLWETMQTGTDIAVRVEFGPKTNGSYAGIHFSTAGGDFYRWW